MKRGEQAFGNGDFAGGEWALFLPGMFAIGMEIEEVVENIESGGAKAVRARSRRACGEAGSTARLWDRARGRKSKRFFAQWWPRRALIHVRNHDADGRSRFEDRCL